MISTYERISQDAQENYLVDPRHHLPPGQVSSLHGQVSSLGRTCFGCATKNRLGYPSDPYGLPTVGSYVLSTYNATSLISFAGIPVTSAFAVWSLEFGVKGLEFGV